tara:strand:- start:362 stop:772 length:411 start_codon:yes stop_codon:yes gene_type:complete
MKYIYTFLFAAISATSFAQGNLQYDSTITLGESLTDSWQSAPPLNGVLYTVPDGKTWKITSMFFSAGQSNNAFRVYINSLPFSNYYSGVSFGNWKFPLWLKSGDTIQFEYNYIAGSGASPRTEHYLMSALQFNIVP